MSEVVSAELRAAQPEPAAGKAHDAPAGANASPPGRVAELRVSAHLMTLETGLYCIFPTPGSPDPDAATGLPGVRVTPAPGIAGRPEAVSVSTFREDGWLNGTAALVRVTDGSAQILVSVYQDRTQGADAAPRLQVLRLSKEPNGAATEVEAPGVAKSPAMPRPAAAQEAPPVAEAPDAGAEAQPANPEIMAHIQRRGDVGAMLGEWVGHKGSKQWVEGFGLAPKDGFAPEDIEYQGVLGRNWLSPWVEGGKYCGSRGMALPLLGLKVRLKGEIAKQFDCTYAATFVDGTEIGPVDAGEPCEAESLAPLESFRIIIRSRDAARGNAAGDGAVTELGAGAPARKAKAPVKPVPAKTAAPKPVEPAPKTRPRR